jgi:hypothetical protein
VARLVAAFCLVVASHADWVVAADETPPTVARTTSALAKRQVTCPPQEELDRLFKPLNRIRMVASDSPGPLPPDCSSNLFVPVRGTDSDSTNYRDGTCAVVHWVPTEFAHQPLYFDDIPLERYGQTICPILQPVLSGACFFGTFPLMPCKMAIDRTHDPIYTLGYYRIGNCVPCVRQRLPLGSECHR